MWSDFLMEEPHFSLKLQVEGLGCGGGGGGQVQEGWTSCGWAAQQPVLPISSAGALHWGELSSSRRVGQNQPVSTTIWNILWASWPALWRRGWIEQSHEVVGCLFELL